MFLLIKNKTEMKNLIYIFILVLLQSCASKSSLTIGKSLDFKGFSASSFDVDGNINKIIEEQIVAKKSGDSLVINKKRISMGTVYYFEDNRIVKREEMLGDEVFNTHIYLYNKDYNYIGKRRYNNEGIINEIQKVMSSDKSHFAVKRIRVGVKQLGDDITKFSLDDNGRIVSEYMGGVMGKPTKQYRRNDKGLLIGHYSPTSFGSGIKVIIKYTKFDTHNNWIERIQYATYMPDTVEIIRRKIVYN